MDGQTIPRAVAVHIVSYISLPGAVTRVAAPNNKITKVTDIPNREVVNTS